MRQHIPRENQVNVRRKAGPPPPVVCVRNVRDVVQRFPRVNARVSANVAEPPNFSRRFHQHDFHPRRRSTTIRIVQRSNAILSNKFVCHFTYSFMWFFALYFSPFSTFLIPFPKILACSRVRSHFVCRLPRCCKSLFGWSDVVWIWS